MEFAAAYIKPDFFTDCPDLPRLSSSPGLGIRLAGLHFTLVGLFESEISLLEERFRGFTYRPAPEDAVEQVIEIREAPSRYFFAPSYPKGENHVQFDYQLDHHR